MLTAFNPRLAEVERLAERRFKTGMSIGQQIDTFLRVVGEQTDAGRYREGDREHRLTIFHNPFAKIPLSPEFAGAYDDQWLPDGERAYRRRRGESEATMCRGECLWSCHRSSN